MECVSVHAFAAMQCLYSDMDYLSGVFTGRGRCHDGDHAAGIGLYRGGYAAGAGSAGNHGTHVSGDLQYGLYRRDSDALAICDAGNQLLFSVDHGDDSDYRESCV